MPLTLVSGVDARCKITVPRTVTMSITKAATSRGAGREAQSAYAPLQAAASPEDETHPVIVAVHLSVIVVLTAPMMTVVIAAATSMTVHVRTHGRCHMATEQPLAFPMYHRAPEPEGHIQAAIRVV